MIIDQQPKSIFQIQSWILDYCLALLSSGPLDSAMEGGKEEIVEELCVEQKKWVAGENRLDDQEQPGLISKADKSHKLQALAKMALFCSASSGAVKVYTH